MSRPQVLWFGKPPGDEQVREFTQRGLRVTYLDADAEPALTFARACVVWATRPHFADAIDALERHAYDLVDEGLLIFVVVENQEQLKAVRQVVGKIGGGDGAHVRIRLTEEQAPVAAYEIAQAALMHTIGPAGREVLDITMPAGSELSPADARLLKRAFHDCSLIELIKLDGGLSGSNTFQAAATLLDSRAGPHPQPFFVKLGPAAKLRQEDWNFRRYAEHHVPFYLRPNFLAERSIWGIARGVLVGNFVPRSRSLWEAVLEGGGGAHIRSLFEDTLGALREEEERRACVSNAETVVGQLEEFCDYAAVPVSRVEAARQWGGSVLVPEKLWRKLLNLPNRAWRLSAMHGDMHGENVRIRKQDAILIDFAHATIGPMSADIASLEAWLVLRTPLGDDTRRHLWQRQVGDTYSLKGIEDALSGTRPAAIEGFPWLHECLQELHRLAGASVNSAEEYARVLAVYFLRNAVFPANPADADDEFRRTFSYWLANRLVIELCEASGGQQQAA